MEHRKPQLKNIEQDNSWLDFQEVNRIIELCFETSLTEIKNIDEASPEIKDFVQLFSGQNISLSTFPLRDNKNKFYIFTDGTFFGYAFLIDNKFAHIDYAHKNLSESDFINNNKYVIEEGMLLQKDTIEHNGSCGFGTATDICEIIFKINAGQDDSTILKWLKNKEIGQERKLKIGEKEFSTNSWHLDAKNNLVELLDQYPAPTINIIPEPKAVEQSSIKNNKSNNQLIINPDNEGLYCQGFEVVISDKQTTEREELKIFDPIKEDIKEDIDYAFCKQNQQNNTNSASHSFGFRFNSEAGKLIDTINNGANDAEKNKAWEDLLTNHDTVIFKLASDGQNYIRFYLNRDANGKIEFAFDECLFSKADALELSKNFTKYDEIKEKSKTTISKNERFDIYLYCKSGSSKENEDNQILKADFETQKPRNKITNISLYKKNQSISAIK